MKLHLAKSKDGKNFKLDKEPFIDNDDESIAGVEDARITKIGDNYFVTFTAYNGHDKEDNIITRIGVAKTKNFKKYSGRKTILHNFKNNKNGIIFKHEKYFYIFHRPFGSSIKTPGIYLARTKNFRKFQNLGEIIPPRKNKWDDARIGANTPPIKIVDEKFGECFLMLYHGADKKNNTYRMGYVLLDKDDLTKVIERSNRPILSPTLEWEKKGEVPNVIFGCGLVPLSKNKLRFFYAGADKSTGYADLKLENAECL